MLSLEEIGYFLHMEECDRKEEQKKTEKEGAAVGNYQVNFKQLLEIERPTHNENEN